MHVLKFEAVGTLLFDMAVRVICEPFGYFSETLRVVEDPAGQCKLASAVACVIWVFFVGEVDGGFVPLFEEAAQEGETLKSYLSATTMRDQMVCMVVFLMARACFIGGDMSVSVVSEAMWR
jgi:hypothetical protein